MVPNGTLFGDGVCARIKEELLKEFNLHTIVRLPNGVFAPYTGIKTNLLFFTKGEPTKEIWFYEHPYPPGVKSYNKTKPGGCGRSARKAAEGTGASAGLGRGRAAKRPRTNTDQHRQTQTGDTGEIVRARVRESP